MIVAAITGQYRNPLMREFINQCTYDALQTITGANINTFAYMTKTNERILFMIKHFCKGNKAEFGRRLGESGQTVNGWLKRNNGINVLNKIIDGFPEINATWLLTGEGEMLKESPSEELSTARAEINADSAKKWDDFIKALAEDNPNMLNTPFTLNDDDGIPQEYKDKLAALYLDERKEKVYWRNKAQDLEYKLAKMGMA